MKRTSRFLICSSSRENSRSLTSRLPSLLGTKGTWSTKVSSEQLRNTWESTGSTPLTPDAMRSPDIKNASMKLTSVSVAKGRTSSTMRASSASSLNWQVRFQILKEDAAVRLKAGFTETELNSLKLHSKKHLKPISNNLNTICLNKTQLVHKPRKSSILMMVKFTKKSLHMKKRSMKSPYRRSKNLKRRLNQSSQRSLRLPSQRSRHSNLIWWTQWRLVLSHPRWFHLTKKWSRSHSSSLSSSSVPLYLSSPGSPCQPKLRLQVSLADLLLEGGSRASYRASYQQPAQEIQWLKQAIWTRS